MIGQLVKRSPCGSLQCPKEYATDIFFQSNSSSSHRPLSILIYPPYIPTSTKFCISSNFQIKHSMDLSSLMLILLIIIIKINGNTVQQWNWQPVPSSTVQKSLEYSLSVLQFIINPCILWTQEICFTKRFVPIWFRLQFIQNVLLPFGTSKSVTRVYSQ